MSAAISLGAELLHHLGLKPWQAMAIQDKEAAPKLIKVFVFDPGVDVERFANMQFWHSVPVTFERTAGPVLHGLTDNG